LPKLPRLGGPAPEQPQEMDCAALDAERARLLAERDDLSEPRLSKSDAKREAELTVERSLWRKSCPAANGSAGVGCAVGFSGRSRGLEVVANGTTASGGQPFPWLQTSRSAALWKRPRSATNICCAAIYLTKGVLTFLLGSCGYPGYDRAA